MKIYKIQGFISELKREKQRQLYSELREVLGMNPVTLSRKINTDGKNDFDGQHLPLIAATISKYLNRDITVDELYNEKEACLQV